MAARKATAKRNTRGSRKRPTVAFPSNPSACPKCGSTSKTYFEGVLQLCACTRRKRAKQAKQRTARRKRETAASFTRLANGMRRVPDTHVQALGDLLHMIMRGYVFPQNTWARIEALSDEDIAPTQKKRRFEAIVQELKRLN